MLIINCFITLDNLHKCAILHNLSYSDCAILHFFEGYDIRGIGTMRYHYMLLHCSARYVLTAGAIRRAGARPSAPTFGAGTAGVAGVGGVVSCRGGGSGGGIGLGEGEVIIFYKMERNKLVVVRKFVNFAV